jgi:hypothetical protein
MRSLHRVQKKNAYWEYYVCLSVRPSVHLFVHEYISYSESLDRICLHLVVRYATGGQSILRVSNFRQSIKGIWAEVLANEEGRALMLLPKYSDRGNHRKHTRISHTITRKHGNDIIN